MTKTELIIAVFGTKPNTQFSPVQIQKILFLIDQNVGKELGGPFYNFIPYHYGPFDQNIYSELEELWINGNIEKIRHNYTRFHFRITENGLTKFNEIKQSIKPELLEYIIKVVDWATSLTFMQLVSAIYKAYPKMKENSIFKD